MDEVYDLLEPRKKDRQKLNVFNNKGEVRRWWQCMLIKNIPGSSRVSAQVFIYDPKDRKNMDKIWRACSNHDKARQVDSCSFWPRAWLARGPARGACLAIAAGDAIAISRPNHFGRWAMPIGQFEPRWRFRWSWEETPTFSLHVVCSHPRCYGHESRIIPWPHAFHRPIPKGGHFQDVVICSLPTERQKLGSYTSHRSNEAVGWKSSGRSCAWWTWPAARGLMTQAGIKM